MYKRFGASVRSAAIGIGLAACAMAPSFGTDVAAEWELKGINAASNDGSEDVRAYALNRLIRLRPAAVDRGQVEAMLGSKSAFARSVAVRALGIMGAKELRPRLLQWAQSKDNGKPIRCAAIEALIAIEAPEGPTAYLEEVKSGSIDRCNLTDEAVLAKLRTPGFVTALAALVEAGNGEATILLGKVGTIEHAPLLMAHFKDPTNYIASPAGVALHDLKDKRQIPMLVELLKDSNTRIRAGAAVALGGMGDPSLVDRIAPLLEDADQWVASSACKALGELGGRQYITQIRVMAGRGFGNDDQCISALALLNDKESVPELLAMLKKNQSNADGLIRALNKLEAGDHTADIVDALENRMAWNVYNGAPSTRPLQASETIKLLSYIYAEPSRSDELRTVAYFSSGGAQGNLDLIAWLGYPSTYPIDRLGRTEAKQVLASFRSAWKSAVYHPRLLNDLEEQVAVIVRAVGLSWLPEDVPVLEQTVALMSSARSKGSTSTRTEAVSSVIGRIKVKERGLQVAGLLVIHLAFWTGFLLLYPRYPSVRALFFWNPWVRKIAGMGYVGLLLTWVPFLRMRMLAPFRDVLLEDAHANSSKTGAPADLNYFPNSEAINLAGGQRVSLAKALAEVKGRIVLEGESGLGKTMFLRHFLLERSKQPGVFLPAALCGGGVIEAIADKLEGLAGDGDFLRSLVYSGALDVVIDGLNEVSPATVAEVRSFMSSNAAGNILVSTQPIDWILPADVRRYMLCPLSPTAMLDFLRSREPTLDPEAPFLGERYLAVCDSFVDAIKQSVDTSGGVMRILSNPMDLSVVSMMISQGKEPEVHALQQQQYRLMAEDYRRIYAGREFPLDAFSECVFDMRINDQPDIPKDKASSEIAVLEKHKMVYRRTTRIAGEDEVKWYFRHDKIVDFFLLRKFLSDSPKQESYIDDARFRGVYFLLAAYLPIEDAKALREHLIQQAVDRRDHTVSDGFIRVLRERTSLEAAQLALAG